MRLLLRFLAKRAAVAAVVLSVVCFIPGGLGAKAFVGLLLGTFAALYKIRLFGVFLDGVWRSGRAGAKSAVFQAFSQLAVFGLLLASILLDIRFFAGVTAGLLTVPLVICINAFTEKTGVTRNRWGDREEAQLGKCS